MARAWEKVGKGLEYRDRKWAVVLTPGEAHAARTVAAFTPHAGARLDDFIEFTRSGRLTFGHASHLTALAHSAWWDEAEEDRANAALENAPGTLADYAADTVRGTFTRAYHKITRAESAL